MLTVNRRSTFRMLGAVAAAAVAMPHLAVAQTQDLTVPNSLQNFKRGTIHSMHPERRSFVIIWQDLGRVKMKAADLVTNFNSLKPGQIIDTHWYDYMDFLIAKKTPETVKRGQEMKAQGARLQGIPGAQERIVLWSMDGMCTKLDPANNTIFLINASGGEPDKPAPNSGEVIQLPRIVTPQGKTAMASIKVGDELTTVWSRQTAIKATIIR